MTNNSFSSLYQIQDLIHCYQGRPALTIPFLEIQPQSIVGLMGPNGGGKSTLLNLLANVDIPCAGQILFKGRELRPFAQDTRFRISLLPQEAYLLHRKVQGNVAYGLKLRKDRQDRDLKVRQSLELVGLDPESFRHRPWNALSGGEARRVALAARMVLRPEVLLLDEPTAGIDAASAQRIKEAALIARQEWGATLIIASHDWDWLDQVCDQTLHLFKGCILGNGRSNIIFGPWRPRGDGRYEKRILDGQTLVVTRPPEENAALLIGPEDLWLTTTPQPVGGQRQFLKAVITRMSLGKKTDRIMLTLTAADLDLCTHISRADAALQGIQPGSVVWLSYQLEDTNWIG